MTINTNEMAFKKCFEDIMALDEQDILFCSMSLDVAVKEADRLLRAATEDRIVLNNAGIESTTIDSLAHRVGAFTYAAHRYTAVTTIDPVALHHWNQAYRKGYEVRNYLIRFLSFAFRNDEYLCNIIHENMKLGRGHHDMLENLLLLSNLAEAHPHLLTAVPSFDASQITKARQLYASLSTLLNRASIDQEVVTHAKILLNRSYTWYFLIANNLSIVGQFLFQGTNRAKLYSINSQGVHSPGSVSGAPLDVTFRPPEMPKQILPFPDDDNN